MNRVTLITPRRFGDTRGWFSETYSRRNAAEIGLGGEFVQDNQSFSAVAGTFRGFHFQIPPHAQAKLVRCTRGRILDYAVDLRRGSPTYAEWVSAELTAENGHQLYIPVGFAHAFLTLEDGCEVAYKVTDYYAPECDGGIRYDSLPIQFPVEGDLVLSGKDAVLPALARFESPFVFDGEPLRPLLGDRQAA